MAQPSCIGLCAAKRGARYEALEQIRQGIANARGQRRHARLSTTAPTISLMLSKRAIPGIVHNVRGVFTRQLKCPLLDCRETPARP